MARYWSGTIGGVDLEEAGGAVAGFEFNGAEAFESDTTGNTLPSINGNPQTQYADNENGKVIEVRFLHVPQALLTSVLAVLTPLLPLGTSVACSFTDEYQTITGQFKPHVPQWYERGNPDGAFINDAVLRLIKTG